MLEGSSSRSSQDTGMEQDDQSHTRHSPGPFHVSASWGFSPGSGFSGSLGLSRASLDSAAGGERQQVKQGIPEAAFQQGLGPPEQPHRHQNGHREDIHTPNPLRTPHQAHPNPSTTPKTSPKPPVPPVSAPRQRAPLPLTALFAAYS